MRRRRDTFIILYIIRLNVYIRVSSPTLTLFRPVYHSIYLSTTNPVHEIHIYEIRQHCLVRVYMHIIREVYIITTNKNLFVRCDRPKLAKVQRRAVHTTLGRHDRRADTYTTTTGREHKVRSSLFLFFLIQHAQNRTMAASGFHERLYVL